MVKSILFRILGSIIFLGLLIELLLIIFNRSFMEKNMSFNFAVSQSLILIVYEGMRLLFFHQAGNENSFVDGLKIAFIALAVVALFVFYI